MKIASSVEALQSALVLGVRTGATEIIRAAGRTPAQQRCIMTFKGKVVHGAIILPPDIRLPEGLQLEVNIPELSAPASQQESGLLKFAGIINDLPADFAANHDHYIHGAPKR